MAAQIFSERDSRLLVGVAVSHQSPVACHQQRKTQGANPNVVDHSPELFQVHFAHQRAVWSSQMGQRDRDGRGREEIVVDGDRCDVGSVTFGCGRHG